MNFDPAHPDTVVCSQTILTADDLLGPYTIVKEGFQPLGMDAGDFDLVVSNDKAYYYFERVHSQLICAELTNGFTDVSGVYSTHFPRPYPPYVREAPAYFFRNGKHYLVTSGTTGYFPNPSEVAVADSFHGEFTVLGNLHPSDASNTSFHSQISCIFKVQGKKDLYVACADRWLPNAMDLRYEDYSRLYESNYDASVISPQEKAQLLAKLPKEETNLANYVWLPLCFDGDTPYVKWLDEWKIEDFD